jgi:DNA primase
VAGLIRQQDVAYVRENARVDEVVADYVTLTRAGGDSLKGLCPFHDEKTASFHVRPSRGTFHCFGCAEGGDVISFVSKIEHLEFVEAVQRLADKIGFTLTYSGGGTSVARERGTRSRLLAAHRAAAEFYAGEFGTSEAAPAREFLAARGFDEQAAAKFGCGFAPAGWDTLTKHLLGKGFELAELYTAQLAKEGRRGPIDKFRRRLLWPLKDLGGDVVGFGARRIFDDDPIEAKYLNTAESPIFKKSQVLFGIDHAKREIAKRHQAVVVEGYTDVMAMHAAGVPTAVAACGTAFGEDHLAVLRRLLMDEKFFRGEVIFTFDGDAAGKKAALKAFDGDQGFAGQTYIAVAPEGMDPCELRQANGEVAVRDLVARRVPLFEFAMRSVLDGYDLDSVDGRVAALQRTVPLVAQIKDAASRDGYATKLAGWVGWPDESTVVRRVRETAGGSPAPRQARPSGTGEGAGERPNPRDPALWPQREALKIALQEPTLAGGQYAAVPEDAFTHPLYAALHRAVLDAGATTSGLSGAVLVEAVSAQCERQVASSLASELAVEPLQALGEPDAHYVESVLARLQGSLLGRQIAELKSKLQRMSPVEDAGTYRSLFGDLVALEEWRRSLTEQAAGG